MKHFAIGGSRPLEPRRFLDAWGVPVDLDQLLADRERRRVELQDDVTRTKARLRDVEQRLQGLALGEPRRYTTLTGAQVDLEQELIDTKRLSTRLENDLAHLDDQLEDARRRIRAFDRHRSSGA